MKNIEIETSNGCAVEVGVASATISDGSKTVKAPDEVFLCVTNEDGDSEVVATLKPEQAAGLAQALEMATVQVLKNNHGMKTPF